MDPTTGRDLNGWTERCSAACYDCLLSYTNQLDHRHLDRNLIRDLLFALTTCRTSAAGEARTREEQIARLRERLDPASECERRLLEILAAEGLRLPNYAQHCPEPELPVQVDFYFARDGLPGICIFVDGAHHGTPAAADRDRQIRDALRERGYQVVELSCAQDLRLQLARHDDLFLPS